MAWTFSWIRGESDDASVVYTGAGWGTRVRPLASEASQQESDGTGARSFTWTTPIACTRVRLGTALQSDGCQIRIVVDDGIDNVNYLPDPGTPLAALNDVTMFLNAPSPSWPTAGWQQIIWTSAVMPNMVHKIKVSYVGPGSTGGNNFPIDFMEYESPAPPGARSLTENFDTVIAGNNVGLDTTIWTKVGVPFGTPGVAVSGGNLVLPIDANANWRLRSGGGGPRNGLYDILEGEITLHVASWGDWPSHLNAHGFMPMLMMSSKSYGDHFDPVDFNYPSGWYTAGWFLVSPASMPPATFTGSAGLAPYHDGFQELEVAEPLDVSRHLYLRMREAVGVFYWEYSADGVTWVQMFQYTYPRDWNLQRCMIRIDETLPGF